MALKLLPENRSKRILLFVALTFFAVIAGVSLLGSYVQTPRELNHHVSAHGITADFPFEPKYFKAEERGKIGRYEYRTKKGPYIYVAGYIDSGVAFDESGRPRTNADKLADELFSQGFSDPDVTDEKAVSKSSVTLHGKTWRKIIWTFEKDGDEANAHFLVGVRSNSIEYAAIGAMGKSAPLADEFFSSVSFYK